MKIRLLLTLQLLGASALWAEVKPHGLFCDNAVLQQGMEIPVWGTARDGETVSVEMAGQSASATAHDGKWEVRLPKLAAGGPYTMTIKGDNTVTLQNIMVGEVWLCSGQSNMARTLVPPDRVQPRFPAWEKDAAAANYPQIREFAVGNARPGEVGVSGHWDICTPQTAGDFTAVGFYFARALSEARHVPVGLIKAAVGATGAATWTPPDAFSSTKETQHIIDYYQRAIREFPERLAKYDAEKDALLAKYRQDLDLAKKNGSPEPRQPTPPTDPSKDVNRPSYLFLNRIAPLAPFAFRGILWYQGEQNSGHALEYRALFPALIAGWRKTFSNGQLPFLFVQLPGYKGTPPEMREVQREVWRATPGTFMVVTTDCGDPENIHPPNKQPVGERLARAARGMVYGEDIEFSGPSFESVQVQGGRLTVSFSHTGGGLSAKDGELSGFEIAGSDKVFQPAWAEIQGSDIVLTSAAVPAPVSVRYGWQNIPTGNLINRDGLPASPFIALQGKAGL